MDLIFDSVAPHVFHSVLEWSFCKSMPHGPIGFLIVSHPVPFLSIWLLIISASSRRFSLSCPEKSLSIIVTWHHPPGLVCLGCLMPGWTIGIGDKDSHLIQHGNKLGANIRACSVLSRSFYSGAGQFTFHSPNIKRPLPVEGIPQVLQSFPSLSGLSSYFWLRSSDFISGPASGWRVMWV